MAQYLDKNGLTHLISLLKGLFVKQETGKGLSTNDFTDANRDKLAGLSNYDDSGIRSLISGKVDKETGKGLSQENYTTAEKTKLAGLSNYDDTAVRGLIANKQDTLVSGTNIKTINNKSIVGSGNITIETGVTSVAWSDITNKPETFTPSAHTHAQSEITGLADTISNITNIASGKTKSYVFETVEALDAELTKTEFTAQLKVGDVFLIVAVNVPDYWWTGSAKAQLETTKVDISRITETEITEIVNSDD